MPVTCIYFAVLAGDLCRMTMNHTSFRLNISSVDHAAALALRLPPPWEELRRVGFHADLLLRAAAYWAWCLRAQEHHPHIAFVRPAELFLLTVGTGFLIPFNRGKFPIDSEDPFAELKGQSLDAVEELAQTFGDRVPTILWDTLAFISCREAPTEDRSIIGEVMKSPTLPHHYTELDACLHALGKVYSLNFHVASIFYRHTGYVPIHNCDCGCSLHCLAKPSGGMHFVLPSANIQKATESFATHLFAEFIALASLKIPFEFGVGDDAAAALAIERDGL